MEKLPSTSYIRLVDIWLVTTQLYPFISVVLITMLELVRGQTAFTNHHGFFRYYVHFYKHLDSQGLFRNVENKSESKEAFMDENKKKAKKKVELFLQKIETTILPGLIVVYTLFYWSYCLIKYFGS